MDIGGTLTHSARRNPDGEALIFGERRLTWRALNEGANRFANALSALGWERDDRAVLFMPNLVEFVEAYYGLAKIGGISAPMLTSSVGAEIAFVANHLRAKYLLVDAPLAPVVREVAGELGSVDYVIGIGEGHGFDHDYHALTRGASPAEPAVTVDPDEEFTVKYTSGTTGAPKGCVRTHRNFIMAACVALIEQPILDTDIASINSPLAAGMAISELVKFIIRGTPTAMMPRFDAGGYLELVEREKVTFGYAMESLYNRLVQHPDLDRFDLSSLRIFSGGPPEAMERLRAHPTFRGGFATGFGSSEAGGRVTFINPGDYERAFTDPAHAERLHSLGSPGMLYRVEAVDEDFQPVPAGELGELVISGPSVFKRYWENEEETARAKRDGWLITGDLIRKDEGGFIYLSGRVKDMIKTGGVNVYPAEIEPVLAAHPGVAEVAVVGVPDKEWGEKVVACVVAGGSPCTADELLDFCKGKLAGHKRPKSVVFLDEMPTNEVGKTVKRELRDIAARLDQVGTAAE